MGEKIFLASDHAGFALKEKVKAWLKEGGFEAMDKGCHSPESCDYPVYASRVGEAVANGEGRGIVVCGSGMGVCMVVNKFKGVRGAACWNEESARLTREHNDANVLCLGARLVDEGNALKIAGVFLETPFSGEERHQRRVKEMDKYC